jgi:MFS family permease
MVPPENVNQFFRRLKDMKSKIRSVPSEPWKPAMTTLLLAVFALSVLMAAVSVDMVTPVLPHIGEQFVASEAQVSWVVSGVALVLAIGVPLYGRMADLFEFRELYCSAVAILSAGSLLCALVPNLLILVVGRMVQGAGMAAIPVLSVVAISKVWPPDKRGGALGVIAGCIGVGTAGSSAKIKF